MKNFIAHTEKTREELLNAISCTSVNELFKQIPVQFKEFCMGNPLSELEIQKKIKHIAKSNKSEYISFIGLPVRDTLIVSPMLSFNKVPIA